MRTRILIFLSLSFLLIQSCKIHRALKQHQKGEYEDAWAILEKVKNVPDSNDTISYLKYSFVHSNISIFRKFNCTDSLARNGFVNELVAIRKIQDNWNKLGLDTSKIIRKYSLISERFVKIEKEYLDCIKVVHDRDSLAARLVAEEDSSAYKDTLLMAKKVLEEPHIITEILGFNKSAFEERAGRYAKNDLDSLDFSILAEVVGKNGEDVKLTFSLQYRGFQSYPKARYKTPITDDAIDWFALAVCELGLAYDISCHITGTADANKVGELKYTIGSKEWGDIHYSQDRLTNISYDVDISKGSMINNMELAFLRAYNAEQYFTICSAVNTDGISIIDHIALIDGKKGAKYRTVEIVVLVKGVFTDEVNMLKMTKYYEYLERQFSDQIEFKGNFTD
jgi:hypothetical protein